MSKQKEENKDIKDIVEKITIKSRFEGVYPDSQSKEILRKYKDCIKILNNLSLKNNLKDFELSQNEIEMIFGNIKEKINYCRVKNEKTYFAVSLNFDFKGIDRNKKVNLNKQKYEFTCENTKYYCFEIDSMKKYLDDIFKKNEYYIEITPFSSSEKKILRDINQFLMLNFPVFKIVKEYQFKDINYKEIKYDTVYKDIEEISGKDLNLKLGLYVSLSEYDYNNFKYYETEERKNFCKELLSILNIRKELAICGSYGSGKTITLLRMIISDLDKKYLYVNLGTVKALDTQYLKKLLLYEITKLFSKGVIFSECVLLDEVIAYKHITKLINELNSNEISVFFSLLENIIIIMNELAYTDSYFIIDQYSSKYDIDNKFIKQLINANKKNHIIFCYSMNNKDVKFNLCKCLNEKTVFTSYHIDFIFFLYVGSLIRLNKLKKYQELINDKSQEFVRLLNLYGNIPLYYYLLNKALNEKGEFNDFVDKEKENIIKEISNFYENNKNNKYDETLQMLIDILKIISSINNREIFFFDELSEGVSKLPLKFLEIKKETLKINDLKLFGLASNNQKIKQFIEKIEKEKSEQDINTYQLILENYVRFFNEEKYCTDYISKLTDNEKKELGFVDSNIEPETEITIFYLDYLFPMMEEIFSSIIYTIFKATSKFYYYQLSPQSKGGLIELIINEHVKKTKTFLIYNIAHIETIENFVPNEFFIQNYTTRKSETLRTFIENKNPLIYKKKKLPNGCIFFIQLQFTGKYYDCAVLRPNLDKTGFSLLLLQISKKKISTHRFFKEEHMIILNRVKKRLESEYDITITEGYFSYILISEEPDDDTISFCKNNNLNYILFSIENLSFIDSKNDIFNNKSFITYNFPVQSSFSILPKNIFKIYNKKLLQREYIEKFQQSLIYENIDEELKTLINELFENSIELPSNDKNEYYIFGHFDKIIEVNNTVCIWFDNNSSQFYYYQENCYKKFNKKYDKKLSGKNFTLICSKYAIKKKDNIKIKKKN